VSIAWEAQAGKSYQLKTTTNLLTPWHVLATDRSAILVRRRSEGAGKHSNPARRRESHQRRDRRLQAGRCSAGRGWSSKKGAAFGHPLAESRWVWTIGDQCFCRRRQSKNRPQPSAAATPYSAGSGTAMSAMTPLVSV